MYKNNDSPLSLASLALAFNSDAEQLIRTQFVDQSIGIEFSEQESSKSALLKYLKTRKIVVLRPTLNNNDNDIDEPEEEQEIS